MFLPVHAERLKRWKTLAVVIVQGAVLQVSAQIQTYETNVFVEAIAGSGFYGYLDGSGVQTMFNEPNGLVVDGATNVFVWDSLNYRIRKIAPDGNVSTFAGSGLPGHDNGIGTNASFAPGPYPPAWVVDQSGNLYFGDGTTIKKISPLAEVTTFAGKNVTGGYLDTDRTNALFSGIRGLAIDLQGNIYVADSGNQRIRKIGTNDLVTTFAGSGNAGHQDGNGIFTSFSSPAGLAVDLAGNVFVGDTGNYVIRKITPSRDVTTFAGKVGQFGYQEGVGTNALLRILFSLATDELSNLYVADQNTIRKISPEGRVTTLAGSYSQSGYVEGEGYRARFAVAWAITSGPAGRFFVTDRDNHRIRKISYGALPTTGLTIGMYAGLSIAGTIGRSYRIEFVNSLANSNDWTTASTISLTSSPFLWVDNDSKNFPKRFYRAVLLP